MIPMQFNMSLLYWNNFILCHILGGVAVNLGNAIFHTMIKIYHAAEIHSTKIKY